MSKDTIIPVKFNRKLTMKELDTFAKMLSDFERENDVIVSIISMSAVAKRVNKLNK